MVTRRAATHCVGIVLPEPYMVMSLVLLPVNMLVTYISLFGDMYQVYHTVRFISICPLLL